MTRKMRGPDGLDLDSATLGSVNANRPPQSLYGRNLAAHFVRVLPEKINSIVPPPPVIPPIIDLSLRISETSSLMFEDDRFRTVTMFIKQTSDLTIDEIFAIIEIDETSTMTAVDRRFRLVEMEIDETSTLSFTGIISIDVPVTGVFGTGIAATVTLDIVSPPGGGMMFGGGSN